jgi:hypothetical protein
VLDNGRREDPIEQPRTLRAFPFGAWHEDESDVLWWHFPIREPPYVGSPLASDWPFDVDDERVLGWTRFVVPDAPRCDHEFVDSTRCLKCGWTPPLVNAVDPSAQPRER